MWLVLHGLRAAHHVSAESLLYALHQEDGCLTIHFGIGHRVVYPLLGAVLDLNLHGITGIELAHVMRRMAHPFRATLATNRILVRRRVVSGNSVGIGRF